MGDRTPGAIRPEPRQTPPVHPPEVATSGQPEKIAEVTTALGAEIAYWDIADGVSEYLFHRAPDTFHLVKETLPHPDAPDSAPIERTVRLLSREEVIRWFYECHICGFVPAGLREAFRPAVAATACEETEAK